MKTNGNDCANPISADVLEKHRQGHFKNLGEPNPFGLTKREHFAAMAKDDFDTLPNVLQRDIVGYDQPSYEYDPGFDEIKEIRAVFNIDYALWLAKGRSKWKLMQADELIKALNEGGENV